MRILALFWISFALASCATPIANPWLGLDTDLSPAATPLDCGSFPLPSESHNTHVVYDKAGLNDLNAYRRCSEANEAIVTEHALQIGQLKLARKGLTEAGQAQRLIAEMREEALRDERRHHFYSSIGYWVVIVALGAAL